MDKTLFEQKIQRAVDGGRFGLWFRFAQQIEQIVCADGTLLQTHQAQHFEALRRQAHGCAARRVFQLAPVTLALWSFPCSTSNGMKV
ncbi:Uncharacterised protein [Salmonella enterica subsp. enterica]|uniref:Uncharacterized protein n=1 Tax=Salmonella enterica I TaxID=59201 RepID=A0A379X2A3_SALET|nr:Uncharacterised protein [Salmonella enterica subsp. enterica]